MRCTFSDLHLITLFASLLFLEKLSSQNNIYEGKKIPEIIWIVFFKIELERTIIIATINAMVNIFKQI